MDNSTEPIQNTFEVQSRYKVTGNLQHYRQTTPANSTQQALSAARMSPERFSQMVFTHYQG